MGRARAAFCLGLTLAAIAIAQGPADFGRLQPRATRKHALLTGEKHHYHVAVDSGQFFQLIVEKKGIDLALSIADAQGREVASFNSPTGSYGFEYASVLAVQAGTYTVEVSAKGSLRVRGQYRITLRTVRAPSDADRLQLRAQTLFRSALDADRAGDEANLRKAAGGYAETADLYERLNEPYLKALALHRLGLAYDGLHDTAKALEAYNQAVRIRRSVHDRGGEGTTLNNIGAIYVDRSDKPKAVEFFSQALRIRRGLHDRAAEAASLISLAKASANPQALEFYHQALAVFRATGDRAHEAMALVSIGDVNYELPDMRKAEESYSQALAIFRALGQHANEGTMLSYLGLVYSSVGESRKELEVYNQALAIYRALGDRADEATMVNNLGQVHVDLSEPGQALEFYNQALQIRRALGERRNEAVSLESIGSAYSALGDKPKALEFYRQALEIGQSERQRSIEGNVFHDMGAVHSDLAEYPKALELFNQALSIRRALGDGKGQAHTLGNIGIVYERLGQKRKALEFYSQALPVERAAQDRPGEAKTLNNMASVYTSLGENRKALDLFTQTLAIVRSGANRTGEADVLCNMGKTYSAMGENRKALDFCFQALTIHQAVGVRANESLTLEGIGNFYSLLGEQQKALEFFTQALQIHRDTRDRAGEAETLNDVGVVYSALGDNQKALDTYLQSLSMFRAVGDRWDEAKMLVNIGNTYQALGDLGKAMEFYDQAMPIFRAGGDRYDEAEVLDRVGTVLYYRGEKEKALALYNQALPLRRAVGDRFGEARTLDNIGQTDDELGQKQKALPMYQQALAILRAVANRDGEAVTLNNLQVLFAQSQPDLAIFFGKQAVNVLQTVRRDNRGLQEALRQSYEKSIESSYRNLAALLIERHRFAEAEEVLGLLKDKETNDFVQRDGVADQLRSVALSDTEKAALARYEQVQGQVVALGQKKAALLAKAESEPLSDAEAAQSEQYDRDLNEANTVAQRFFEEVGKSFAANSAQADRLVELRRAQSIQETLAKLGPDVVAIYTVVAPDRYIAMLVTSGAHKAYTTVIRESELNGKIFEFRNRLRNPASDPLPLAQELYRIVFPEGLRQDLESIQAKTIMWSVDGALRYIPMAALHDGHDYLVKRFRNSLITPSSIANLLEQPQARWQGLGYGMSKASGDFPALDAVPAELHGIFRSPGSQPDTAAAPLPGTVRLDEAFTRAAVSRDMLQLNHRVVHIATHFDSRPSAEASNLLLGDGTLWNLKAISAGTRIFNGVDLLTLSACSTAFSNKGEDGKEVDSLATLAQDSGAKSVIASLWSVSDEATAQLMQTMYRLRQEDPKTGKSEALRKAQEMMLSGTLRSGANAGADRGVAVAHPVTPVENKDWRHPFFWAPFILIGNWK